MCCAVLHRTVLDFTARYCTVRTGPHCNALYCIVLCCDRPGGETVAALGGLHGFSNWPRGMLTDSGGFQMVSLLHLADITEEGVTFQSPVDGSRMLLTPEESIAIQNNLGADIMMQLDDVVPATNTGVTAGTSRGVGDRVGCVVKHVVCDCERDKMGLTSTCRRMTSC